MKVTEIRNLSVDEIDVKVGELRKSLLQLRFEAKNQKLEQLERLKFTRKDIARFLTVKREKQLEDKKETKK